ncbi:hypothetical protein CYMTET_56473 [Cymbomonas tetramitiformis]|uniref:BED-type domain-containing protein n=1 Tax=Cymbomonas tetramitiformis TaxID=36881 RepID=A0AAE0BC23_9CHLO|nr:hypothetical protein CYMTET_56473 [Cymbomonas tetramitiformis]
MGKRGRGSRSNCKAKATAGEVLLPQGKGPVKRVEEDSGGFQKPAANLRSRHFSVRMEGKKIVEYRCNLCGPDSTPKEYCGNTSNLRTHLAHCHKGSLVDIKTENCETEIDLQTGGESSSTKKGNIEALLPQPSAEQRDRLHRSIVR